MIGVPYRYIFDTMEVEIIIQFLVLGILEAISEFKKEIGDE
jgi:hypothetical protein